MVETTTTTTTTSSCWSSIVQKQPPPKQQQTDASQVFESCKSSKGIAVAVVDANAIIQGGENLRNSADKFVWVSEVAEEVKDATSRRKLTLAPFTVEAMEPSTEALKKVINFARATGDLQTLSDVDLKLIALTYTLEAQIHGTNHLRDTPPPVHMLNVKRMSEKEMPGWGSNVPNLDEWEALEHAVEAGSNSDSRILPLKDLNLNLMPIDGPTNSEHGGVTETVTEAHAEDQEDAGRNVRQSRRYAPVKKEINLEGKKMVADGIDASQGQDDNDTDWLPAVSRSTHRRFLRRKARRELSEASSEMNDYPDEHTNMETNFVEDTRSPDLMLPESSEGAEVVEEMSEEGDAMEGKIGDVDLASILKNMRLEADSLDVLQDGELSMSSVDASDSVEAKTESADITFETDVNETCNEGLANMDTSSNTNESVDASFVDDNSSEQSWMLRSMSESSVACITSDFAMQNVILQIGLRLLAPGGMQIRKLHRWILKCHACNKVTAEIGRIFCPKCGNGGTLRRVAVTVGENGITLAARRPRINLRGTKFSLPMPQGGRDAITKNMILREDQLPHKLLYPKKKKSNKQGEDDDIFIRDDVFCHTSDKRTSFKPPVRKALAVFSGKRNPNDNHFSRAKH